MGVSAADAAAGGVHGFPAALTSFIGRAGPVREVAGLLAEYRLVTVTGPGGVGKTRLAGQVARAVAGRFADGAWLAELAPVGDPAQVPGVVAAALGVREQPGVPVAEALARVLARQQLLLVLDNCEHLIGAAAQLCAGLLAACDDVRVLATSREPLRVAGEARYRLGPLTLPGAGDPAEAGGSEAVALFADRARQADAQFALTARPGRRWRGWWRGWTGCRWRSSWRRRGWRRWAWPSWPTGSMTGSALLTGGDRLAPARHRSLAAAVEWSYRLLGEEERRVFRAVSVFPGPFTLEAAEAVAGPGAGAAVLRLVDCSLLVPPREGPDGRWRYAMLQTLRAYGAGLLAGSGEQDAAAAALAGWAVQVAGQAAAGLQTIEGEAAAARWLDAEDATMAQVLAWAMDHDTGLALQLVAALGWWWYLRARLAGQYPLLREAAGRADAGQRRMVRRAVLGWATRRGFPVIRPRRWAISPRCGTRPPSGGRARRWPTAWPAGAAALVNMGRHAEAAERCPPRPRGGPRDRVPAGAGASPGASGHRRPLMPAIRTVRCGWPGRPGRSPRRSPAR